ncbi:MAG: glycosyl transferase family 1, partial [Planctomycetota bacterium]
MRIVYLNPAAGLGGAERCLLDMMAAVRETEPSSELLLVTSAAGPLIERAKRLGVQVILLPMPKALMKTGDRMLGKDTSRGRAILELGRRGVKAAWPTWRYARSLTRTLTELGPDLVQVPVVWHIHDFLGLRPLMARALLWASAHTRGGIAVSHAVQLDAQAVLRGLPVDVIYNGIDTDEFSPQQVPGAWLDHLAGFTEEGPETVRVGLVATFARW